MQELKGGKVPVCIRPEYIMYFESFNGNMWFHTDIFRWTSEIKRRYSEDVESLLKVVGVTVLALVREDDIKLKKFAKSFGWTEKCQINLVDGSMAYIYASKRKKGE